MNHPVASIIVPSRGGAARLPVLFRALARQDRTDFEVIPVLDGDVDGSGAVLERLTRETGLEVRPVVFGDNRGRSAALNAGMDVARGEILIRCDDDLEPAPGYVAAHVRRHEESPRPIGVVGPCENQLPDTPYARVYGVPASAKALRDVLSTLPQLAWRHWAGNVSLRVGTARRVGPYDLRYRRYGWEDVDYGYRLKKSGVPVVIAEELITPHHMAATSTFVRSLRALHAGAAREQFVAVHGPRALPEPPGPRGTWPTCVWLGSKIVTEELLRVAGAGTDVLIRIVPQPVGEKLVALLVESAGKAGVDHPRRARTRF